MATIHEQIQELAKHLKADDAREVLDYMRWLLEEVDTEPLSEEERLGLAEAEKERAQGGGKSWKKVKRDLGL